MSDTAKKLAKIGRLSFELMALINNTESQSQAENAESGALEEMERLHHELAAVWAEYYQHFRPDPFEGAPPLARFKTVNSDNTQYWHDSKPKIQPGRRYWVSNGENWFAGTKENDWQNSLIERKP